MSRYTDVYVFPVPRARLGAYKAMIEKMQAIWKEHGALEHVQLMEEDVKPGTLTSFPQALNLEPGEIVVVGWTTFASKADRDRINDAVRADPRLGGMDPKSMPFDTRRMFFGGFTPLLDEARG